MLKRSIVALALLGALLGMGFVSVADEPAKTKKDSTKDEKDEKVITTKASAYHSAKSIDFAKELGLSFESLSTLGERIEQSRKAGDPVCLMLAATELAACEKASGKEASLTAKALLKEAATLAKLRRRAAELKVVALLTKDEAIDKELEALAKKAAGEEADLAKGAKPKGLQSSWTVENGRNEWVQLYVNGVSQGWAPPLQSVKVNVWHPANVNTQLYAITQNQKTYWGPVDIFDVSTQPVKWQLKP